MLSGSQINIHKDLIEQCRIGERKAQTEIYKLYSKAMYNISYRILKDELEAEDVLQESFLSAFRNIGSYRGDASFGAWLKRIVVNTAINQVRKRSIDFESLNDVDFEPEKDTWDDEQIVLDIQRVRDSIEELPDGFRTVFSLYLLEGYDHREIGEILGISESTSKSQYNRAKKKLREILSNREYKRYG
ncbi:RNA polymerase sigma factor [Bacteroidota bacterium]